MPRDIPVSNGHLLVTFDKDYFIRDIYYPFVGQEDHSEGHPFRFGIWVDGAFAWVDRMRPSLGYLPDTMVTDVQMRSDELQVVLHCNDAVDFEHPIYIRKITINNLADKAREVRLFFHHDFHIYGNATGDTAYYDPDHKALIHYNRERYFMVNTQINGQNGFSNYACGYKELGNYEGTWKDAEDGVLSGSAIAQGSVDSTGAIHFYIPKNGEQTIYYWIAASTRHHEMLDLNDVILDKSPERLIQRTQSYWNLWLKRGGTQRDQDFAFLPAEVRELYNRSLLIIRTQVDHAGAIIAANDTDTLQFNRDTYSYMWPRDGALVAMALDESGHSTMTRRFFYYCSDVLADEGYFLHKYNPDGTAGSSWHPKLGRDGKKHLPIQEDETALILHSLWHHFAIHGDVEFISTLYYKLIKPAGDFLVAFRDKRTGLPDSSYDLWEERRGIHTWSVAATWAGLDAAEKFASCFNDAESVDIYSKTKNEIKDALVKYLFDPELNRFLRTVFLHEEESVEKDYVIDSSMAGVFLFGVLEADDPRVKSTMEAIKNRLWCQTPIGGIARFENDTYHRTTGHPQHVPGNPWIICTLWLAQYHIAIAKGQDELKPAMELIDWATQRAFKSGVLPEQVHPMTGAPLSVSPLTWSHATYVETIHLYANKAKSLSQGSW